MTSQNGMAISWFNGRWGPPGSLAVPLSDRGLLLADGLFETVLIRHGRPQLLSDHLQRWRNGAALLAMAPPPETDQLQPLINEAIDRSHLQGRSGALRLNWSRGDGGGRGIDLPDGTTDPNQHRFWLTLQPHTPTFTAVHAWISCHERRNAASRLSHCKTFAYGQAIQARLEARSQGAEEALLLSSSGELCCGSTANLLVQRDGQWLTPPLSSGCLPGVMRGRAIREGIAREQTLKATPQPGDAWLLINSLSCRPLRSVNGRTLNNQPQAQTLWESLLSDE